jgi:hypothetical protein
VQGNGVNKGGGMDSSSGDCDLLMSFQPSNYRRVVLTNRQTRQVRHCHNWVPHWHMGETALPRRVESAFSR